MRTEEQVVLGVGLQNLTPKKVTGYKGQMQGYILTTERERNVILGDDGVRYNFVLQDWQADDSEPAVDMRVQFEVRGTNAVYVFPLPDASGLPPVQPLTESNDPPRWLWGLGVGMPLVLGIGGVIFVAILALLMVQCGEWDGPVY